MPVADDFTADALMDGRRAAVELVCGDVDVAERAMTNATRALEAVRHPEEPEDAFVNFVSRVYRTDVGAWFWFDAKDIAIWPEEASAIIEAITSAAGADGLVQWTDREPPPPSRRRERLDRELAIALPDRFPLPPGAVPVATRFYGYPEEWEAAHWSFYVPGDAPIASGQLFAALADAGYEQGEFQHPSEWRIVGVSEVHWSIRSDACEGDVRVGAVLATEAFREFSVRQYEEFAWMEDFANGDGWQLWIVLRPGSNGWRPY